MYLFETLTITLNIYYRGPAKYVRLGDLDIATENDKVKPQEFKVARRIPHPDYKSPVKYNDIAVITLDRNVTLNEFVAIACLDVERNHDQETLIAAGWGQTEFAAGASTHLLKAQISVVNHLKCTKAYPSDKKTIPRGILDDLMICAGGTSDTCYVSIFINYHL